MFLKINHHLYKSLLFLTGLIFIFIFLHSSCRTQKEVKKPEEPLKKGLIFIIPPGMDDSTKDAKNFRYNHFIIQKNMHYYESDVIISIRQMENISKYNLTTFSQIDQMYLRQKLDITYFDQWDPPGLKEKEIKYESYYFKYHYGREPIYQKSIYIEYLNTFYIISFSSKNLERLKTEEYNPFWESIRLVY